MNEFSSPEATGGWPRHRWCSLKVVCRACHFWPQLTSVDVAVLSGLWALARYSLSLQRLSVWLHFGECSANIHSHRFCALPKTQRWKGSRAASLSAWWGDERADCSGQVEDREQLPQGGNCPPEQVPKAQPHRAVPLGTFPDLREPLYVLDC